MKKITYKITYPRERIYIGMDLTGGSKTCPTSTADESGEARTA